MRAVLSTKSDVNITSSVELRRLSRPRRNIRGRKMATVLLAEDDADIRFLVTFKLTQAGYQVRVFGDGLSALADARENPPELAVLDVMMPGMSGLEVCRELRKDPATAKIPVIILTALAQEADIAAGFAAGAVDYIVKPFSPRDFALRVQAVLARAQASAPPG
jgi:DNA-binding response OmpR family regulator